MSEPFVISTAPSIEMDGKGFPSSADLSVRQRSILGLLIDIPYYTVQSGIDFVDSDEAIDHYIDTGWHDGLDPSPTFQSMRYANTTPSRPADKNPFIHYLFDVVGEAALIGAFDRLNAADIDELRKHFDADFYLDSNPDVALSANDPLVHYMTSGWRELRDPSPSFNTNAYLDLYSDVRNSGTNPFYHWVFHGIAEGRSSGETSRSTLSSWDSLSVGQQTILTRIFDIEYYQQHVAHAASGSKLSLRDLASVDRPYAGNATPSFCASKYLAAHPEIRGTGQVPFLHYLFAVAGEDALRELFVAQTRTVLQAACEHFDAAWYLYSYPDVEASGQDALIHYMTVGWREDRDPSQDFSTKVYLLRYPDIVEAGVNPFLHWIGFGKDEGRSGVSSANNFRKRPYAPEITAILVNGENNPLTADCILAVVNQSYKKLSIVIIGASLSRECQIAVDTNPRKGLKATFLRYPEKDFISQWALFECAAEQTAVELLWFVQGRVVHDLAFLARLASSFADGSVQLGFGKPLEHDDPDYAIDADELARRMEGWSRHPTTPAALWFPDQLQRNKLALEQHSFLWRRRTLSTNVWRSADDYRYLGLWHCYLHMVSGGQIAMVRDAVMRIPPALALSPLSFDDDGFLKDMITLEAEVRSFWGVPSAARGDTQEYAKGKRHVLIVTHGIFAGGAENLPIQLANALVRRGIIVSMLIFKIDLNPEMRATLDPGCSIYEADWVMEYGCEQFLRDMGCDLIHSHGVIGEMFFYRLCQDPLPVPYVATLHGSYEAASSKELPEWFIGKIVREVDLFVYTADKNLGPLLRHDVRPDQVVKMINAMPMDKAPFPRSRAELGIAEDAVVFTLVARGIPEKGWFTAINAFKAVQKRNPGRLMHLCLVGEGDEPDRLKPLYANDPSISFLGFQLRIHGLYRMTDVAIVPTRFAGESFPLCIIQALQVAVPVIATDVGEIAPMLEVGSVAGGLVVESSQDDKQFDSRFTDAMHSLIDNERRQKLASGAAILGNGYDMDVFTDQYIALYDEVLRRFAASRSVHLIESIEENTIYTA